MRSETLVMNQDIEREFQELERRLAEHNPGVLDVLRFYGELEPQINDVSQIGNEMEPPIVATNGTSFFYTPR